MQTRVAISTLLDRAPGLRLTGEPEFRPAVSNRGVATLPIAF